MSERITIEEMAQLLSINVATVGQLAQKWSYIETPGKNGIKKEFIVSGLPVEVQQQMQESYDNKKNENLWM